MDKAPWITIIGLGEDGPDGLPAATRKVLDTAEVIMGPPRHLSLLPPLQAQIVEWPVPFAQGITELATYSGRDVVILASGDPFWFGAGTAIARAFDRSEWRSLPQSSTFSLAASHLGWALDTTVCLGLHAVPLSRVRPYLAHGVKCLLLLRDGDAVQALARFLIDHGFGDSRLHVLEAIGGPRQIYTEASVSEAASHEFSHPVCVGVDVSGGGTPMPLTSGLPDTLFETDGVMTKRAVRAVTLSSLAPRPNEVLWDIGSGTGSIAIEWLLAHPSCSAIALETRMDRIALIEANAKNLGADRLQIISGKAPEALSELPPPDAIFVGGGLSQELIQTLHDVAPKGTRLVANAVTLEAEALLMDVAARLGGELMRLDVSTAQPLGAKTAWKASYPIVHWSGQL